MTEAHGVVAATARPLPARIARLIKNLPERLDEREFWVIQGGVLGVTAIHILAEMWVSRTGLEVPSAFHHIPVVLYLGPIGYASLRYGTEGAVLTGLWSAVLTLPNLFIWHRSDFGWLEILYVIFVVIVGVVMSLPVERERLHRRRAEATTQRLELLNSITALTLTVDLESTIKETLRRLVEMLHLEAACVALTDSPGSGTQPTIVAYHSLDRPTADVLTTFIRDGLVTGNHDQPASHENGIVVEPVIADLPEPETAGRVRGLLAAKISPGRPITDEDRELLAGVASHVAIAIANQRLTESERDLLRSYAMQMTEAQEEERKRIARELHDEAAQNVVVIKRKLAALANRLSETPVAAEIETISELAGQTVAGMRRFSRDLRPPTLDELGLISALEQLLVELGERSAVSAALRIEGRSRRLPIETELAIFRIGQAAVHNVERHAAASSVTVHLRFEPELIRMEVRDDGRGFEAPRNMTQLNEQGKLGLIGMHERAQLVSGRIQIDSRPGTGTAIVLEVPA
ncbi:MAG TPA: GAF domain-containing sensor histidine kinase [Acidimicrobiia bacterium]